MMLLVGTACPTCRARITSMRDLRKDQLVGNIISKVIIVRPVLPCENQLIFSSCVVSLFQLLLLILQSPGEQSSQRNQITRICEQFADGIRR